MKTGPALDLSSNDEAEMAWCRKTLGLAFLLGLGCYPDSDNLIRAGSSDGSSSDGLSDGAGDGTGTAGRQPGVGGSGTGGGTGGLGTGGIGVSRGGAPGTDAGAGGATGMGGGMAPIPDGGADSMFGSPEDLKFVGVWNVSDGSTTFPFPCPATAVSHAGEIFEVFLNGAGPHKLFVDTPDCLYDVTASGNVATLDPGQNCQFVTPTNMQVVLTYSSGSFTLTGNNTGTLMLTGMAEAAIGGLAATCPFTTMMVATRNN
jgi:hypothetical protein